MEPAVMYGMGTLLLGMAACMGVMGKFIINLLRWNNEQQKEIDKTRQQLKTVWDFQMRRAQVEVILAERKSMPAVSTACDVIPRIPAHIFMALATIAPDVRTFYRTLPPGISDDDAKLEIEERFGQWLMDNLCVPHNQTHGECLVYALSIAKT